ncbi:MAG: hypothetical protein ACK5V3_05000 [Bdellovibrionales bacterium]
MILYIIIIWVLYYFYHKFESEVRHQLWSPSTETVQKPLTLILSGLRSQIYQLNEMNLSLSSLIDWQLKLISFRELMIRICLSRISSVILLGLILVLWNQPLLFFIFIVTMGLYFFVRGKTWGATLFPVALIGVFYLIAGLSMDSLKGTLEASSESYIWFWLADGRAFVVLSLMVGVFLISLFLRKQGLFFLIFLPLFLLGFVPPVNFLSVIFAETIANAVIMLKRFSVISLVIKSLFREILLIKVVFLLTLIFFWLVVRGTGGLEVRVLGGAWDKKILFVIIWSLSEIALTSILMLWGHFRFKTLVPDPSELSAFVSPTLNLKTDLISAQQKSFWLEVAQVRCQNVKKALDEMQSSIEQKWPPNLIVQSSKEVESLGSFIELMKSKP